MLRIAQNFIRRAAAYLLATAVFATVAPVPAAHAEALKIGYCDWPTWTLVDVGLEQGWFEEAGVEVEMIYSDYVGTLDLFAAGQLDGVFTTQGDALVLGATADTPSTCILITDYSNGNDMLIARPGIDSIQGLKGKKVAVEVGFVNHLLALTALQSVGMTEDDVEIVNMPTPEMPGALASGDVDAIAAWQPATGTTLENVGGSKALFTSADAPGIIYDSLYVRRDSLATRRDDWKKFVKVWFRIIDYIRERPENREEAVRIGAARTNVEPEQFRPLLDGAYILSIDENIETFKPGDDLSSMWGSSKFQEQFNLEYKVYAEPEFSPDYLDPSIVKEIKAELGE